jgi:hypothetical protein
MEQKATLTYTFNMGTQNPFGVIFIAAITIGALTFAVIMDTFTTKFLKI